LSSYWIFILFLLSFSLPFSVFAEPVDVEIDWLIEGQIQITKSVSDGESDVKNNSIVNEQINRSFTSQNKISEDTVEDFITGSEYMISGREITIDSEEGQLLNRLLIEQREINKENFFHMIKYLDRYSDGYVELAEALLDPVRQQKYQQSGGVENYNINSNLEYFLIERGYDLNNLESIPNNAFSPTKYDAVRTAASKAANSGVASTDLRELLPNYVKQDSKIMHDEMIRKLSEQTSNVYDSISSNTLEISVNRSPDLTNTITNNLFDDFQFVNTEFGNNKFESTQHVIDTLGKPEILLEINSTYEYSFLILISITILIGLIIFGYLLYRKSSVEDTLNLVTVPISINYVENTNNMIESSRVLFANNSPKYAFEKFSQAIRYYYSNKLKINLDLTTTDMMFELEKSNIDNFNDIRKWLLLCGQVEFIKHKSTQKEFLIALDSFSKSIS
tara:strand:- start:1819 stop:3162 length:1344 start_codon:yes stop_codon:yes gene_type:complete